MKRMRSIYKSEKGVNLNYEKILTKSLLMAWDYQFKRELRKFPMENASMPYIDFGGRVL